MLQEQRAEKKMEVLKMPVKKANGGYRVVSYVTGKTFKRKYRTKAAAERAAKTSMRRSRRVRSTRSKSARMGRRRY
jgi:hypothetical protein